VFSNSNHLPIKAEEKARYEAHNNSIEDQGYVNFLMQAIVPALYYLTPESKGLDYGCGPGPTLSALVQQNGYRCHNYDPFFFPELPEGPFDFIFATECFEHFFEPSKEMELLSQLLMPHGHLIIMTNLWEDNTNFANWHYTQDTTHVIFFHEKTFSYIAKTYGFQVVFNDGIRVIILKKN
jgi:SAM-dependent methyltransferase